MLLGRTSLLPFGSLFARGLDIHVLEGFLKRLRHGGVRLRSIGHLCGGLPGCRRSRRCDQQFNQARFVRVQHKLEPLLLLNQRRLDFQLDPLAFVGSDKNQDFTTSLEAKHIGVALQGVGNITLENLLWIG
jgi:hypothetical protein